MTDSAIMALNSKQEEFTTYNFENIYDEATVVNDPTISNPKLVNIFLRSNFLSKKQWRGVEKLQDYIGYIGGFWSFLFLVFARIGRKYNKNKFLLKIAKSLYYFPDLNTKGNTTSIEMGESIQKKRIFQQTKTRRKGVEVREVKLKKSNFKENIEEYMNRIRGFTILKKARAWFSFSPGKFLHRVKLETELKKKTLRTMYKDIDIIHLLGKIKEIDKLKSILLDINQKNLFEYITKSKITLENDNHFKMNRASLLFMLRNRNTTDPISNKENLADYKLNDFYILYKSYMQMLDEKDPKVKEINMKIIKTLDNDLLQIFKAESDKCSSPNQVFSKSSKNSTFTIQKIESK